MKIITAVLLLATAKSNSLRLGPSREMNMSFSNVLVLRLRTSYMYVLHIGRPGLFLIGDDSEKNGNVLYSARNARNGLASTTKPRSIEDLPSSLLQILLDLNSRVGFSYRERVS